MQFDFARFVNIRGATDPAFSPDGGQVAFITEITGTPQVWAVASEGGWPEQLTFFSEKVWSLAYSPVDNQLIASRDVGGNERQQLFLISGDGMVTRRLTRGDDVVHNFGAWSHDGRRIAYAANDRNGRDFDLYVLDIDSRKAMAVRQGEGASYVLAWSPDDHRLLWGHAFGSMHQQLFLLDLSDGQVQELCVDAEPTRYQQAVWAADGTIYVITDRGREFLGAATLDPDRNALTYFATPEWDVEALAVSPAAHRLAYLVNEDGYSELHVRTRDGKEMPVPIGLPHGVLSGPVFSPDGRWLAVSVQSPTANADIWLVDVESGQARQVTHSSRAGIPQELFVEPELVRYPTFDGRRIPAFFYRPKGIAQPPVILYVHGGPESQLRPEFDASFQYFLHRGYAIFAPNVRGSSGYGKTYTSLDDVYRRMDAVADLKYAAEWLRASGQVDPQRIVVYGRSYGGFMVLAAMTTYPDLWAAGIDVVGIANWVTFLENTGPWRRQLREAEYGSLQKDRAFLESISPIRHVDRIRAPLLVMHGANDPRVPITEAEQVVAGVRAHGGTVEYVRYEDEGHKFSRLSNRIDAFTRIATFLDGVLSS